MFTASLERGERLVAGASDEWNCGAEGLEAAGWLDGRRDGRL